MARFEHRVGALAGGGDLECGSYTVQGAMQRANELGPRCVGFTFNGDNAHMNGQPVACYFKCSTEGNQDPAWQTYTKARSAGLGSLPPTGRARHPGLSWGSVQPGLRITDEVCMWDNTLKCAIGAAPLSLSAGVTLSWQLTVTGMPAGMCFGVIAKSSLDSTHGFEDGTFFGWDTRGLIFEAGRETKCAPCCSAPVTDGQTLELSLKPGLLGLRVLSGYDSAISIPAELHPRLHLMVEMQGPSQVRLHGPVRTDGDFGWSMCEQNQAAATIQAAARRRQQNHHKARTQRQRPHLSTQVCPACDGKGGFDNWQKPQRRGHMHYKMDCYLCQGKTQVLGKWAACQQCKGKGGFDIWGKPQMISHMHFKTKCQGCGGKGFMQAHGGQRPIQKARADAAHAEAQAQIVKSQARAQIAHSQAQAAQAQAQAAQAKAQAQAQITQVQQMVAASQAAVVADFYPSGHPKYTQVIVPAGVVPGGQFAVNTPAGAQIVVTCPPNTASGQHVKVPIPDAAPPAAPVVHAVPAPLPASAPPQDDLHIFLTQHRLQQYHTALVGLGAQSPADLNDLEEADMDSLGMKKLEKSRLRKALSLHAQ